MGRMTLLLVRRWKSTANAWLGLRPESVCIVLFPSDVSFLMIIRNRYQIFGESQMVYTLMMPVLLSIRLRSWFMMHSTTVHVAGS